ncbi:MAG: hypothetical protein K2X47_12805 [Bdellovibrionales bacterium]|nr:hypothetical protein [Bdellovibrionales bacterium]
MKRDPKLHLYDHMKSLSFFRVFIPVISILIAIGCGPQVSQRASQPEPAGSTTTGTTEFGPKTSAEETAKVKAALVRLMQFPDGAMVLRRVRPKGFEEILPAPELPSVPCLIDLQSAEEIRGKNGHTGGGISKDAGTYSIQANQDSDVDLLAHIIRHEMHHILEDIQLDVLSQDPKYNKLGEKVVTGLMTRNREVINQLNPAHLEYLLTMLMCGEIRAYETNHTLTKQGLKFSPFSFETQSLEVFVNERYLVPFFRKFPDEDLLKVGTECRAQKTLLDFHDVLSKRLLSPGAH